MFNPINIFSKLIKSSNQRLDRVQKIIQDINLLEKYNLEIEFPKKTDELIEKVEKEKLNDILPQALLWQEKHQKE